MSFRLLLAASLSLGAVGAGCGVRTGLHVTEDDTGPRADAGPRDVGFPDSASDGGRCTSDRDCDDSLTCNGFEACVSGQCVRSSPLSCEDGVPCTADLCVEGAGCVSRPDDTLCPPNNRCVPNVGCVPTTTGCRSDIDCDDGLQCNGREVCDLSTGFCATLPPMDCSDGVSCTDDVCIEGFGCAHQANSGECSPGLVCDPMAGCQVRPCGPGGSCDDGDPCNGVEFCAADGRCQGGSPLRCDDGNACTMDFCVTGAGCVSSVTPESCRDGVDNDCNGLVDCSDFACLGRPECNVCEPFESNCFDGRDDDCNGLPDCADPACTTQCGCVPTAPFEQNCFDGRDDDCNGLFDCIDPQCGPQCGCMPTAPFEQNCFDGRDDDCNGLTDCSDVICARQPGCGMTCVPTAPVEVNCLDMRDDDCNGLFDCSDPQCARTPMCGVCTFPEVCNNGLDDDCNGLFDCEDPFCAGRDPSCPPVCTPTSRTERRCNDFVDDDCDGLLDCADPDCRNRPGCGPTDAGPPRDAGPPNDGGTTPRNELGVAACSNGLDDDRDGRTDCADPDCSPFGPMGECCNGRDDNGDGNVDEFTCRCFDQSFCGGVGTLDQTCWTSSYSICAPRCNFYGGNSFCQMFLPGMPTCNAMTGECQ
ncbi:MAG: hypothetical protein U0234_22260 [Sandaracinus sp.]